MSTDAQVTPDPVTAKRMKALAETFGDHFIKSFQSPVVFMDDVVLASPTSVRFFRKDFAYLSKQLYLEYQYRSWKGYNIETVDRYNEIVSKKLANIRILMSNNINRLQKLCEQNNAKIESSLYSAPVTMTVPVIATHARTYVQLLQDLDKINQLAGTANLFGAIDSQQRADAEFLCKKAVRAFRSVLQTEVIKLYREADRMLNEQRQAGKVDPAQAELVAQHGKEIKDFEESTANEGEHEVGMDMGNMDPGDLIDQAAAASTAMANKSKSKAKAKATTAEAATDAPSAS